MDTHADSPVEKGKGTATSSFEDIMEKLVNTLGDPASASANNNKLLIRLNTKTSSIVQSRNSHPVLDALVTAFSSGSLSTSTAILSADRLQRLDAELKEMLATTEADKSMIDADLGLVSQWFSSQNFEKDVSLDTLVPLIEQYLFQKKTESENDVKPVITPSAVVPSPKIKNITALVTEASSSRSENVKKRKLMDDEVDDDDDGNDDGGEYIDETVIDLSRPTGNLVSPIAPGLATSSGGPTIKIKLVAPPKPPSRPVDLSIEVSKPKKIKKEGKSIKTPQSPMEESLKPKVLNQVPINVFWNYVEAFFRPFTDEDINFLASNNDHKELFTIPPLGRHYREVWEEEDKIASSNHHSAGSKSRKYSVCSRVKSLIIRIPNPIATISSSTKDGDVMDIVSKDSEGSVDEQLKVDSAIDPGEFEERLGMELKLSGIIDETERATMARMDSVAGEEDEISKEIRSLQRQLYEQQIINRYRKSKLLKSVYRRMISQEFQAVTDDLDKQIEVAYGKKKSGKPSKKNASGHHHHHHQHQQQSLNPQQKHQTVYQLVVKRKNLLRRFRDILPMKSELAIPEDSIYSEREISDAMRSADKANLFSKPWIQVPGLPLTRPIASRPPAF